MYFKDMRIKINKERRKIGNKEKGTVKKITNKEKKKNGEKDNQNQNIVKINMDEKKEGEKRENIRIKILG